MRSDEYTAHDALSLAEIIRQGQISPREALDACIDQIERWNPKLNAVVDDLRALGAEMAGALSEKSAPFYGVPLLLKDLMACIHGQVTTSSCGLLTGHRASNDTELVARYRRGGFVFAGRTNTPEFGILGITEPRLRGPARNPWHLDRSTGGSSGGSGAAVAAGLVPLAHGGDGGGSIRIPASACGLFGLKPSRGRNPLGPDIGESWGGIVQEHVLTRTVRDAAAALDLTAGVAPGDPYAAPAPERPFLKEVGADPGVLRVAWSTASLFGRETHPECARAVEQAATLLTELGHEVEQVDLPVEAAPWSRAWLTLVAASVALDVQRAAALAGKKPRPGDFEAPTWFMGQLGRKLSAMDLEHARGEMHRAARVMGSFFERYDVFVNPTMAHLPVTIGHFDLKWFERAGLALIRALPARALMEAVLSNLASEGLEITPNTQIFNLTGQPAMSVPLHVTPEGLPVGVQCAARYGDEATLFRLAGQLEQAAPWVGRYFELWQRSSEEAPG
ncbi:MAG: amidase [Bradymonadia bacterium]